MSLVPVPQPALFANLFSDASNDPHNGDYRALLAPFDIDINNAGNNVTPDVVRQQIAAAGNQRVPLALVLLVEGRLKPYFLPFRLEQAVGATPNPAIDGKIFAYDGELIHNQGILVEIINSSFSQITNQVQVGTVAHIKAQLLADTDPHFMMGPFDANDGNTEAVRTRYINVIPYKYVGLFLSQPDGITPRYYFDTILPQIENDGLENVCLPLTRTCQVAITRRANDTTSLLQVTAPLAPPRNTVLLNYSHALLLSKFPQELNPAATAQATLQPIAARLTDIHQQRETHYQEAKQEKAAKAATSVESWIGKENLQQLLNLSCVPSEAALPSVWKDMAMAAQKDRLGVLQGTVRGELRDMGEDRLAESFYADPNLLTNLHLMNWAMVSPDSLETGCLGNAFMFGDLDVEYQQMIMKLLHLIQSGGASPSLADAQKIMKMKVKLPGADDSLRYVRRLEGVCRAVLPVGHPATTFVSKHHQVMKAYDPDWSNHATSNPDLRSLKGVLHLAWLSVRLTQYFRKQARSVTAVTLTDPDEIIDKIERQEKWEPILSPTFIEKYNVRAFLQLGKPIYKQDAADDATAATDMSTLSGSTGSGGSSLSTQGSAQGGGSHQGSLIGGPPRNVRVDNTHFNSSLFSTYKSSSKKSAELRKKIEKGDLRPLPKSKVDSSAPMCLAWHTKGQCNTGCPLSADHVQYTAGEYTEMVSWCQECYNKEE